MLSIPSAVEDCIATDELMTSLSTHHANTGSVVCTCASGLHREIVTRHWPRSQTESYPSEQFNLVVSRLVANNISVLLYPLSHFRDCKALLVTSLTHVCGAITSVQTFTFIFICLLSRRSRQRERLYATGVSICSSVCLSVCRQIAKTQFSQNLSNLELWSLLTTNRKSYMGF